MKKLTHDGQTLTVAQWAKKIGIKEESILFRLSLGWTTERALVKVDLRALRPPRPESLKARYQKEYWAFHGMQARCYNKKNAGYKDYGGRGIKVCELWLVGGFEQFLKDVGPCPPGPGISLDRYPDNDGNYEPGNVRWATREQQANNTRSNRRITHDGRTMTVKQWAKELGMSYDVLWHRLQRLGLAMEEALKKPVQRRKVA